MDRSDAQRPILATLDVVLADADATEQAGARLAPWLQSGMVVTLSGALGTGKTTLVRGLLRAVGVRGSIKSPTFALVEVYEGSRLYWYHFDFYKIVGQRDVESAGLREYFRPDSICLIEWPERAPGAVRHADLALTLEYAEEARRLRFAAYTETGLQALKGYKSAGRSA